MKNRMQSDLSRLTVNDRSGGHKIIAAELIQGEEPTRSQQQNGKPTKLRLLKLFMASDPEIRSRVKARVKQLQTAEAKDRMTKAGMSLVTDSTPVQLSDDADDEEFLREMNGWNFAEEQAKAYKAWRAAHPEFKGGGSIYPADFVRRDAVFPVDNSRPVTDYVQAEPSSEAIKRACGQ